MHFIVTVIKRKTVQGKPRLYYPTQLYHGKNKVLFQTVHHLSFQPFSSLVMELIIPITNKAKNALAFQRNNKSKYLKTDPGPFLFSSAPILPLLSPVYVTYMSKTTTIMGSRGFQMVPEGTTLAPRLQIYLAIRICQREWRLAVQTEQQK